MTSLHQKILIPGFLAEADRKMRLNRPVLRSSRLHFVLWFTFLAAGISAVFFALMPENSLNGISDLDEKSLFFVLPAGGFWVYKLWSDALLKRYPWQIEKKGSHYLFLLILCSALFSFLSFLPSFFGDNIRFDILCWLFVSVSVGNTLYLLLQLNLKQFTLLFIALGLPVLFISIAGFFTVLWSIFSIAMLLPIFLVISSYTEIVVTNPSFKTLYLSLFAFFIPPFLFLPIFLATASVNWQLAAPFIIGSIVLSSFSLHYFYIFFAKHLFLTKQGEIYGSSKLFHI